MIDLTDISGLPVSLDEESCKLCPNEEIEYTHEEEIRLNDIAPILLNKFVKYPEHVGYIYKKVGKKSHVSDLNDSKASYDLIVIPFGLLGIEFNKSHIFYSEPKAGKYSSVVEVLRGEVTLILQENEEHRDPLALNTIVERIEMIKLKAGQKIAIPTGFMYSFVNTGSTEAVLSTVCTASTKKIDYEELKREKGLAFFIISKNAKVEVVANPKYKVKEQPVNKEFSELSEEEKSRYTLDFISEGQTLYDCLTSRKSELESQIA